METAPKLERFFPWLAKATQALDPAVTDADAPISKATRAKLLFPQGPETVPFP